jgi:hypothetical protein
MAAAEQKKSYAVYKNFKGLNTKSNRTAIDEEEFSWIENAMPIGFGNIRIVPAQVTVKDGGNNAISFGNTVTTLTNTNLGLFDYLLAFQEDGRAQYVIIDTGTVANIAVAGTFSSSNVSVAQWKNEEVFIGDPDKGLFSWNSTDLLKVGGVGKIALTARGSGYTSAPAVTISAPNQTNGTQATAEATITANAVTSIEIVEGGTGYTAAPTVTITGGGGSGANAIAELLTFTKGALFIQVTNSGSGYDPASPPAVTITGGGGANAAATAIVFGNTVTDVVMTNVGNNFTSVPTVTIAAPPTPTGNANAVVIGVPNLEEISSVATFSGRVWVSTGRTVTYSSSTSPTDFTSVSAGSEVITDSTLRGNIQYMVSANNFLYIYGEDSINVFSDVRITNTGDTLFTNTNVSASVGSKLKYAVFPYFRSVLFMNNYGVYALVGSTTSKISDQLDGIFPYIDFSKPVTGGQVLLNNILCAAFNFYLLPSFPTTTGNRFVQCVFFEKKWFITSQGALRYLSSAPVGGLINMYGVTDTALFRLYGDATANISSEIQTSLSPMKDPIRTKQALKFGVEATLTSPATFNVTVDSESASSPVYTLTNTGIQWINNFQDIVTWTNNSSQVIPWVTSKGYNLYKSDAQQYGKYLGLTITSNNAAFIINTIEFEHELRVRF